MSVSTPVRELILERLRAAEAKHGVRILYACESGSRAWGFASHDSDFDVRFIYTHDRDWYLSFDVERRRDVIEYPIVDEIDCNGWDLRKALYLFSRTNGALLEWLRSPICYIKQGSLAADLRHLAPSAFNPTALCFHYRHMAQGNARDYLFGDQVRLKKYFYVLRPLLAILHIERGLGLPPVRFEELVARVAPEAIRESIDALLALKRISGELGLGEPIPIIQVFITSELGRTSHLFAGHGRPALSDQVQVTEELNRIFRRTILETGP